MRKLSKAIVISLVVFSLVFNTLLVAAYYTDYLHLGQLLRLTLLVKGRALSNIPFGQMIDGAAGGIVKALHDPYSTYLKPEDFNRLQSELEGIFGGVGLILDTSDETRLQVVGVLKTSPAEKAGIRKGDVITAVNGQVVSQIKSVQAADLMKGQIGTEVTLTVQRGKGNKQDYRLKRELISIKSVEGKFLRIPDLAAYIKINSFTENTLTELTDIWEGLSSAKGIVLDLRDNPGGGLEEAVQAANYFVPKGPVVHLVYRDGNRETYEVKGGNLRVPLVVLVNRGTASAAEILAAAVQDTGSGLIVGTKTYGKGVVQTIYDLDGIAGLKLTTAKYLSALGNNIDKVGIEPDVVVEEAEQGDPVLAKALKLLKERI